MAISSGTASSYVDLLARLETFLTTNPTLVGLGQNWTTQRYATGISPIAYPLSTLSFRLSGAGGIFNNATPVGFPSTNFKMLIEGTLTVPSTGSYTIAVDGDECVEVIIDGSLAVGWYGSHTAAGAYTHTSPVTLNAGTHSIQIHLVQVSGDYSLSVGWQKPGDPGITTIPAGNLSAMTYQSSSYSGTIPANGSAMSSLWAEKELIIKAPGMSGTENIYVGIRPYQNVAGDFYNWQINGFVGYNSAAEFENQPYKSPDKFLYLWNSSIPYWFIANGQRVVVVAKVSTVYQVMYLGKWLPYALPTQYPYPLLIAGSDNVKNQRWSVNSYNVCSIQNPGYGSTLAYVDSSWLAVQNRYESGGNPAAQTNTVKVWPTYPSVNDPSPVQSSLSWPDGGYTLLPLTLYGSAPANNVYGEIDGLYWVSGHQNASETVITVGGDNYLCVQNIQRTTAGEYLAIRMV